METLDQGSPPSGTTAPLVETAPPVGSVAGTYVAPAAGTTSSPAYAAPVENTVSGLVIPPDFGTGHVHVAAGHPEFPVGLVSCHVGTITGRAYVGVDCPNGDSVVGFASSLNDFPFILNPDFPFQGDEGFLIDAARSDAAASDAGKNNVDVLAAMPDGSQNASTSDNTSTTEPQIGVAGASGVQYAQKSRSSQPTVETSSSNSPSKGAKSNKQDSGGSSSTRMQRASQGQDGGQRRTYGLAQRSKARSHERHQPDRGSDKGNARSNNGGNAKSHHQKDKDNQKGKGNQKTKGNGKDKGNHKDKSGGKT